MDYSEEIHQDLEKNTSDIDPTIIDLIRLSERIKIFSKLRELIYEKQFDHDHVAENVLGWAYEKLAD
jgi:Fe-S-cluster formation regulator IscX/YfhJ